jgi:hypothetical protein
MTGYRNLLYTEAVEAGPNNCPSGCMRYYLRIKGELM